MNKKFQLITSILIVLLVVLLVWIFISYYKESSMPIEPVYDNTPVNIENFANNNENETKIIPEKQTENDNEIENNNENNNVVDNTQNEENKQEKPKNNQATSGNGIIMTSNTTTSNAEKQKVLTEIDNALNELLIVVDIVKTVDEERLGLDIGNEVQP